MIHLVGYTRNDVPVQVDLVTSEAAKHIARQPNLLTLATEALRNSTLHQETVHLEYDMKRTIGYDFVVQTGENDTIFYAQLVHDDVYTRFIKHGKPDATSFLTITLQRSQKDSSYNLHSVRIGRFAPPRPGSPEETEDSKAYWENHAIIFDNQPMQLRTLTKERPY